MVTKTHFSSDLDIVFLHANGIEYPQRLIRVAQRVIHLLTTLTGAGRLYEVDTRLRPNGSSGLLVSSIEQFSRYQENQAWTWEHQALARARAVAGDPELGAAFETVRTAALTHDRDAQTLRAEVVQMREKMRTELDRTTSEVFDVKQGRGGLADIAFMAQESLLRCAVQNPALIEPRHTCDMLDAAGQVAMPPDQAATLKTSWLALVTQLEAASLQQQPGLLPRANVDDTVGEVAKIWRDFASQVADEASEP